MEDDRDAALKQRRAPFTLACGTATRNAEQLDKVDLFGNYRGAFLLEMVFGALALVVLWMGGNICGQK